MPIYGGNPIDNDSLKKTANSTEQLVNLTKEAHKQNEKLSYLSKIMTILTIVTTIFTIIMSIPVIKEILGYFTEK